MTLPKSVKVRSTCNACQQAKIRCSHEKPSCRRCQKHNIDCVYSMSRRLGRPAKKRDPDVRKRKPKKEPVEDASQDVDFSTDSWLQDFITDLPVPESGQGLLDTVVTENNPLESIPTCASTSVNLTDTDQRMPYYDPAFVQSSRDTLDMALLPMDMDTSASPADTLPSISTPISPPIDPSPSNVPFQQPPLPNPQPSTARAPAPRRPYEYEYPFPDAAGTNFDPYTPPSCQCQCHEQTLHELVRVNMTLCAAARTAPAGTIDAILTCQRGLQNLAEAILSCSVCAGTRVTLLTVVMVGIDSFISAMEVITTTSDELFPKYPSPQGIGCSSGGSGSGNDSGSGGTAFKSQIEACQLLVRDFRMPPEERYIFVKQVLQTRLGGLLTTIRRIRFCTQEMLAGSVAKGRLIMMMETDRRLQMVMMRIRMINR